MPLPHSGVPIKPTMKPKSSILQDYRVRTYRLACELQNVLALAREAKLSSFGLEERKFL